LVKIETRQQVIDQNLFTLKRHVSSSVVNSQCPPAIASLGGKATAKKMRKAKRPPTASLFHLYEKIVSFFAIFVRVR